MKLIWSVILAILVSSTSAQKNEGCSEVLKKIREVFSGRSSYSIQGSIVVFLDAAKKNPHESQEYLFSKSGSGFRFKLGPIETIGDRKATVYIDHENKQVFYGSVRDLDQLEGDADNNYNLLLKNLTDLSKTGYTLQCFSVTDQLGRISFLQKQGGASLNLFYNKSTFVANKVEISGVDPFTESKYWMDFNFRIKDYSPSPAYETTETIVRIINNKITLTSKYRDYELVNREQ